jgi:hypothetical protein
MTRMLGFPFGMGAPSAIDVSVEAYGRNADEAVD